MTGGIDVIAPQLDESGNWTEGTAIVVPKTRGYQIEFGGVRDVQSLRAGGACGVRGDDSGAVYWCLKEGESNEFLLGTCSIPITDMPLVY
jgi:hypothetical protein